MPQPSRDVGAFTADEVSPISASWVSASDDKRADTVVKIGESRFSQPQQHVHLIQRPALTGALEEGLRRRLVLLQAPAGYGKSTLLAQWRDELDARGVRTVWLSLDKDCGVAAEFLTGIILAADFAGVQVASIDATAMRSNDPQDLRTAMNALLAELGP